MSDAYVGEIRMFGFSRVPQGWLACDGSLQSVPEYEALYSLIGNTYGGNGPSTFALPDLRGRVPIHQGRGENLSRFQIGQTGGVERVSLTAQNLPRQTLSVMAATSVATKEKIDSTAVPAALSGDTMYVTDITGATGFSLAANAVVAQGTNQPHENQMPTLTVQFCICHAGMYPIQD